MTLAQRFLTLGTEKLALTVGIGLATKQHFLPDVLAGAALGCLGHLLAFKARG